MPQEDRNIQEAILNALSNGGLGAGAAVQPIVHGALAQQPQDNLARLFSPGIAEASTIPPSIPVQRPQNSSQEENIPDGKNKLLDFLKRAGIPIGAAIAGSVNPDFLPQAAGLAGGFNKGFNRQEDISNDIDRLTQQNELDVENTRQKKEILDEPSSLDLEVEARKRAAATFDPQSPPSAEEYQNKIKQIVKELRQSTQGQIEVISPDGTVGTIPRNQLQDALNSGFKVN